MVRAQHGGKLPTTRDEKKQFKQSVRELARNDREENMLEAFNMAHVAYAEYRVPADVEAILALAQQRAAAGYVDTRTVGTQQVGAAVGAARRR